MAYVRRKSKLLEDEEVLKEWATKEWSSIVATQDRIFLSNDSFFNKKTIEIPYDHISSLEYGKYRSKQILIAALIPTILSLIFLYVKYSYLLNPNSYYFLSGIQPLLLNFFIVLAIVLFIWFFIGKESFIIHVVGREPIKVSKELVELYTLARGEEMKPIKIRSVG